MVVDTNAKTGAEDVRWDLSDLYQGFDDPAIERDITAAQERAEAFKAAYYGRIESLSTQELLEAVQEYESILESLERLHSFTTLSWTTDTANAEYGRQMTRSQQIYTAVSQQLIFFELEWLALPEAVAEKFLEDPILTPYAHYLRTNRLHAPHALSEKEEFVASELNMTGIHGWRRYFGEVMSAARYKLNGEQLTQSQVLRNLTAPDRELRRDSANAMTNGLKNTLHASTFVFNMMARHKQSEDKLRGYPHWLRSRNISNQTSDRIVDSLIHSVTSRYNIVARHYRLVKQLLDFDTLYDYDRYAPIAQEEKQVQWSEGQDIVLSAFNRFSPKMGKIAQEFFDRNWIDAALGSNKRGGAYSSSTVASAHPYIFMNFVGTLDSVQTLAHELGHGVHQYLSRGVGNLQQSTPLTTAEMASTFAEMLVFDALLEEIDDPKERLAMRVDKVGDTFGTVFRQIAMNRFEDALHKAIRQEGELTTEQLSAMWLETQRDMYGDSVTLRDDYGLWWSYIPHFISVPGYVYAYSFGELLVWSLYANYKVQGGDFADRYLDALSKGGSVWPEELVAPLNVDLSDDNFWHSGLNLIEEMIASSEEDAASLD